MTEPTPESNGDADPASEFDCSDWLNSNPDMPVIDCRFESYPSHPAAEFDCSDWGTVPEQP
jgi:hypothetical protein